VAKSLAIAGKGGTGKSTLAAALITSLCGRNEGPVLAIDADPDSNLGTLLGLDSAESIGDLREEVRAEISNFPAGMSKASYVEAGLHQIIVEAPGFDLLTMGRGEGAGCYCYLNSLIKKFSDDLAPSYSWLVIDNEAGLEHISRRTSVDIDALLIVVSDNPLSLHSAKKIEEITSDLKGRIKSRFLVTNMIREDRLEAVKQRLTEFSVVHLCDIPYDPGLEEIIYRGEPLSHLAESPFWDRIDLIIKEISEKGGTDGGS
jgi:CO dehydrogenase maturation factor